MKRGYRLKDLRVEPKHKGKREKISFLRNETTEWGEEEKRTKSNLWILNKRKEEKRQTNKNE
jgi:hypothetical protein